MGAVHRIESEDVVNAVVEYASGATGRIQAATAFRPATPSELRSTAAWHRRDHRRQADHLDVEDDSGDPAPVSRQVASGASDPMAISMVPFERQFLDFGDAIRQGRKPRVAGEEGYQALEVVDAVYRSCRTGQKVVL